MADIVSRVYQPNPEKCCEACVFNSGKHSPWCGKWELREEYVDNPREPVFPHVCAQCPSLHDDCAPQSSTYCWLREHRVHREQITRR